MAEKVQNYRKNLQFYVFIYPKGEIKYEKRNKTIPKI